MMQQDQTRRVMEQTLAYGREREYTGPDYADGMSSRFLQALPVDNKWVNAAVQETVKRAPVNLRPLFLVPQRRNYKGAALFAMANLNAHRETGEQRYRSEARDLLDWLVANGARGYAGFAVGHPHALQGFERKWEAHEPSVVSTSYAVRALLAGADLDEEYAETASTAAEFLFHDLDYEEVDTGARVKYKPTDDGDYYTLNANALGARMLADLYDHFGDDELRTGATEILDYVVANQHEKGGWEYRDPPSASHLSMDNFHNGFIVESLLRYHAVFDSTRYEDALGRAVEFYREVLFDADGAPNFDEEETYPRDIHACAQGILVYTYLGDLEFAGRILEWTLSNLYAGDGRFYFRKGRYYTKRITLMRWCEAWMAYAVSEYLRALGADRSAHSAVTARE